MPFSRPTLTDLRNAAAADIGSSLPGADALLRFSNLQILGAALAALAYGHYGYLDWISLQAIPFTATDEALEAWAGLKGITRKSATAASSPAIAFPGTNGTVLPAGSSVVRGDGVTYTTTADRTVASGTVTVPVLASVPAAAGNADAGTAMTLGVAIAGIQSGGTATTALTGGADVETDDSLRSRMIQAYAAPPQGGDYSDYIEWALEVPGVTRAWCKPNGMGTGTVVVYTMFDLSEAAHGGFPQGSNGVAASEPRATVATGDQLAVANLIFPLQPVTALVYSVAPIANPVGFTISGLSGASSATQAAVAAAIADVFVREGGPGGALDGQGVTQGTVDLSFIESAIAVIAGTTPFVITSPAANIVSGAGQIPTLGTITWT